jgi:hypothetical protein
MKLLDAAIDDFLLACAADGLAPATIQHYKSKLGRLLSVMGRPKIRYLKALARPWSLRCWMLAATGLPAFVTGPWWRFWRIQAAGVPAWLAYKFTT